MKQKFLDLALSQHTSVTLERRKTSEVIPKSAPAHHLESLQAGRRKGKPKQSLAFLLGSEDNFRARGAQGDENLLAKYQQGNCKERERERALENCRGVPAVFGWPLQRTACGLQGWGTNTREEADQAGEFAQGLKQWSPTSQGRKTAYRPNPQTQGSEA